jgi:dipeptidyl aminopeptidase/acylaminoacyl peptidase
MPYRFLALVCALFWAAGSAAAAQTWVGPTVRDVVEFKRIVLPNDHSADALQEQVSPDGTRAFIVTRKADVATDRNRYEIVMLHLTPDRPTDRRMPAPETVFSFETALDGDYHRPPIQEVRWWDDRTLMFLARLKDETFQVYRLDLPTRGVVQLTRETNPIVSFAAARDTKRLVYAVQVPNPPLRDGARSVVVGNQSFWSVKFGQQDLRAQRRMYRYYVADAALQKARPLGEAFPEGNTEVPQVSISPDGRWALLPRYETAARTRAWEREYPMVAALSKLFDLSRTADPQSYYSSPQSYSARRMTAWRLEDGKEQAVLDAPDDATPGRGPERRDRIWQGNGASVVLAGTHLPVTKGGRTSLASHVIEYWPDSGRWQTIATLAGRLEEVHALSHGFVLMDGGKRREFRRAAGDVWRESPAGTVPLGSTRPAWTLSVAEGLNQPPDIVATARAGNSVRLTTLNPQFEAATWGEMKPYSWRDAKGRVWEGGLMSPSGGVDRSRRYPLVIQSYGFSPDRFYRVRWPRLPARGHVGSGDAVAACGRHGGQGMAGAAAVQRGRARRRGCAGEGGARRPGPRGHHRMERDGRTCVEPRDVLGPPDSGGKSDRRRREHAFLVDTDLRRE